MRAWSKSGPKPQLAVNTSRPRQLADILQTIFLNAFSGMKNDDFQIRFKSNMFRGVQLITHQHWLR